MARRSLSQLRREAADGDPHAAVELFGRTHPMTLTEAVHQVFPDGKVPSLCFDVLDDAWREHAQARGIHA